MKSPVRLQKKQESLNDKIESFVCANALSILLLSYFLAGVIFTILCYQIVGISATDSGMTYNHIYDFI